MYVYIRVYTLYVCVVGTYTSTSVDHAHINHAVVSYINGYYFIIEAS